jgi:hypothetical protein
LKNSSRRSLLASHHRFSSSTGGVHIQCVYNRCKRLLLQPRFTVGTRKNRTLHHTAYYR